MIGWEDSQDKCSVCIHEHEDWGNNEYCKKCKKENLNKTEE